MIARLHRVRQVYEAGRTPHHPSICKGLSMHFLSHYITHLD